jgi:hypothetical protein
MEGTSSKDRPTGRQWFQDCNAQQYGSIELGKSAVEGIQTQWNTEEAELNRVASLNVLFDYFRHYFVS